MQIYQGTKRLLVVELFVDTDKLKSLRFRRWCDGNTRKSRGEADVDMLVTFLWRLNFGMLMECQQKFPQGESVKRETT